MAVFNNSYQFYHSESGYSGSARVSKTLTYTKLVPILCEARTNRCYLFNHVGDVFGGAQVVEVERKLSVDDGQRFGDLEFDISSVVEPLTGFRPQCRLRGTVSQGIVGDPGREVVVKGFGVDDPVTVHQSHLRDQGLVDGIVDVTGLHEQLVGQDGVVRSVAVPALLVDASRHQVSVKGFLQGDQPVSEQTQPEFRKTSVVVFDDLRHSSESIVVLVQQPVTTRKKKSIDNR